MDPILIAVLSVVALAALLVIAGYLKAPPDTAYIISGLGKKRILIGKAGWRVPFFERVDKLSLGVMQVDVKTSEAVPTNEFINVTVDGVANIKIWTTMIFAGASLPATRHMERLMRFWRATPC